MPFVIFSDFSAIFIGLNSNENWQEEELEGGDLFVCAVGLPPVR